MIIQVENLNHIYNKNQPNQTYALQEVNLELDSKDFIGIIGHTGSGKSTLVQHLNGLIKPSSGRVLVDGIDINNSSPGSKAARSKIGLVFQYPEHQLFEETIYQDIAFGPKNQGLSGDGLDIRVKSAMKSVGLDDKLAGKSPFEVSGGQRRRVAIAGVIAMEPEILILDEPTAGLDPMGRDEILDYIRGLHESGIGIIFISHSMEDIASLSTKIIVMDSGRVHQVASPREVFKGQEDLEALSLGVPQITDFMTRLNKKHPQIKTDILTVEEAREEILRVLGGKDA